MNRQSKGDSSHGVVPDALVYSRVLRDIYWQKFNGFLEDFPKRHNFGWKSASVCNTNKEDIFCPVDLAMYILVYIISQNTQRLSKPKH